MAAHRTGLARHDFLWLNPAFTKSDVIPSLQYLQPACHLREKFHYNNLMYTVVGMVIEKVTKQTWKEQVSSRIFNPLAMQNSNSSFKESQKSSDYSLPYETAKMKVIPFRCLDAVEPAGAINSSVSDLLNWIQFQLSDGNFLDKYFMRKETLQEMHTCQMSIESQTGYGLGWFIGKYRGHNSIYHMGEIDGFISQITLLPQQKIGVVVLSNSSDGCPMVSNLTNTIIDKLLETKFEILLP